MRHRDPESRVLSAPNPAIAQGHIEAQSRMAPQHEARELKVSRMHNNKAAKRRPPFAQALAWAAASLCASLPGTLGAQTAATPPSPSTLASSDVRSDNSISVADSSSFPAVACISTPAKI